MSELEKFLLDDAQRKEVAIKDYVNSLMVEVDKFVNECGGKQKFINLLKDNYGIILNNQGGAD